VPDDRTLRRRAEQLSTLDASPGFVFMNEEIDKKAAKMRDALAARLIAGEEVAQLQRQADYDRGFVDGMCYPREVVKGAVNTMRRLDQQLAEPPEPTDEWSRHASPT